MTSADLSRRIGDALGAHVVTTDERSTVVAAMDQAQTWADLPPEVRALVQDIEQRPSFAEADGD